MFSESLIIVVVVVSCIGVNGAADTGSVMPARECSSLVLDNHGFPVFATNFDDHSFREGLVFINGRGVEKTGVDPSTSGEYAHWRSRYASVTFNLVGFQYAWAGMNEAGLTLSTMYLHDTEQPAADQRPPLDSGVWMQYILDSCRTVADVVASDARVRIYTVDHYLVADRLGNCAAIEFLDGEMVVHSGDMPAPVLTNTVYNQSVNTWLGLRDGGNYSALGASLQRFCLAADRVEGFASAAETAVNYAFDTLEIIAGENFSIHGSQWSIVFDTENLRAYFRTLDHPEIRYLDLADFTLGCGPPVQMLDIQELLSGDVAGEFFDFSYAIAFAHMESFMTAWGINIPPEGLHQVLQHFVSFPCVADHPRQPTGRPLRGR